MSKDAGVKSTTTVGTTTVYAVTAKHNLSIADYDTKEVIELHPGINLVDERWIHNEVYKIFLKQEIIENLQVNRVIPSPYIPQNQK